MGGGQPRRSRMGAGQRERPEVPDRRTFGRLRERRFRRDEERGPNPWPPGLAGRGPSLDATTDACPAPAIPGRLGLPTDTSSIGRLAGPSATILRARSVATDFRPDRGRLRIRRETAKTWISQEISPGHVGPVAGESPGVYSSA